MNPSQPPAPSFNLPEPVDQQLAQAPVPPAQQLPVRDAPAATAPSVGDELSADWVRKVEMAIRQGIDDPHALSDSLEDIRGQYIAGRFAKEIKKQSESNS